jgi:two-component system sensor histidine kinase GlrK
VVVTVEDRGPGIPSGELGVVFRAFRRGRETPADAGGVGLGLTLARRWAALLGGELTVHDAGPGARFEFRSADASTNA